MGVPVASAATDPPGGRSPRAFLAASSAEKLQVKLSHPELVLDLVGFLRRAELRASQVGSAIVEVDPSNSLDLQQAELDINLMIRVWRLLHPVVDVVQVSAPS